VPFEPLIEKGFFYEKKKPADPDGNKYDSESGVFLPDPVAVPAVRSDGHDLDDDTERDPEPGMPEADLPAQIQGFRNIDLNDFYKLVK
jgi:hypothetical protein